MILQSPSINKQTSKAGIRPAIGATTKALSASMNTLATELPELLSNTLATITEVSGMALDATKQARLEGQLENVDEVAELVGWSDLQKAQARASVLKSWGIELPSQLEQA